MRRILVYLFITVGSYGYADTQGINNIQHVINDVQKYYIDPVTPQSLYDNAIQGMMTGLDPHCAYLNKQDFHDLNTAIQGTFAGVGLEITMDKGIIRVIAPLEGSPAQKAHIQSGDEIIRLNRTPVLGMTLRSAINTMRGPVGSTLTLTVIHHSEQTITPPKTITLKREIIHVQSVQSSIINVTGNHAYGYIKITQFQEKTSQEIATAIASLKKTPLNNQHLSGLILDLRNNPGGLFNSAVAVANEFIDIQNKKENNPNVILPIIVSTKGRTPQSTSVTHATKGDLIPGVPIVVLINGGSASSAEIVAGALKDNHRAILVGTKTFGKGSVQTVIPITANTAIKLTTALYYTPSGVSIQAQGIAPDIIVTPFVMQTANNAISDSNSNQLTEADLFKHLTNSNAATSKGNTLNPDINNLKLQHDSVIYQALNILKGLVLEQNI